MNRHRNWVRRSGFAAIGVATLASLLMSCSAEVRTPLRDRGSEDVPTTTPATAPTTTPAASSSAPSTPLPNNPGELQKACTNLGGVISPGPAPLRRLTRAEYEQTARVLLGQPAIAFVAFPPEVRGLGFVNNAETQNVSTALVERYAQAAEELAKVFVSSASRFANCDPTLGEATCSESFIRELGQLIYRRPLTDPERARLQSVYNDGVINLDATIASEMVVETMLQSSAFLYKPEFGAEEVSPGIMRLGPYEMATRLSYLIWGAPPDAALYQAAAANQLQMREQVLAQAARLLGDPRSHRMVEQFHQDWLELARVGEIERSADLYPGFGLTIPGLLQEETQRFVEEVFTNGGGTLSALLTAPYTMVNPKLAGYYGADSSGADSWVRASTGPSRHAGLLTQGGIMASHAYATQTSPVRRGKFVRGSLLCQTLPPPPPGVVISVPELDPNLTTRERFSQHSSDPACAGCHRLMDPVGLGFEQFDASGRFRERENGLAIDVKGELMDVDVAGPFNGPLELAQKLAQSGLVSSCQVQHWFRFAYARGESADDACTLDKLNATLEQSGGHLPSLAKALTDTDTFLYRKAVGR